MRTNRLCLAVAVLLGLLSLMPPSCLARPARPARPAPRVLILALAEGVTPQMLADCTSPVLRRCLADGALGLLNTTTAGGRGRADSYASVSLGARALGGSAPVHEAAGRLRVDVRGLVHLNDTAGVGYGVAIGLLRSSLSEGDVSAGYFSTPSEGHHPDGGLMVADRQGNVEAPSWGTSHTFAGVLTNLTDWVAHRDGRALAVVELGGGTPQGAIDRLGQLLAHVGSRQRHARVLFVSPNAPLSERSNRHTLAPVFMWGPGVARGALVSASTRLTGLVANTDIVPSVLDYFSLPTPRELAGRPITVSRGAYASATWLVRQNAMWTSKTAARDRTIPVFVGTIVVAFAIVTTALVLRLTGRAVHPAARLAARAGAIATLWWPVVLTLVGVQAPVVPAAYLALLVALVACLVLTTVLVRGNPASAVVAVSALAVGVVMVDLLTGSHLARHSVLSYDMQTGARFYGLGNECEGLSIGAFIALACTAGLRPPRGRWVLAAASLGVVFIIGSPWFGADVGGVLSSVVAFGSLLALSSGRRPKLLQLTGLGLCGVLLFSLLESLLPAASATHLGMALSRIRSGGLLEARQIATRKLAMDWTTMRSTPLGLVYASVLVGLLVVLRSPPTRVKAALASRPSMRQGMEAATLAAVVAFLFNDSGVVASSMLMIYPFFGFAYIVLSGPREVACGAPEDR